MVLKKGKVSCIVTTYERPIEILKKAIMSIVKQTYDNYEILIVNDSPKNIELSNKIKHLVKLIKNEYCIEITYLSYEKNMGANYARNYGIKFSNGEYVAFLDDDDEWLPEKLEIQVPLMDDNVAIVYSNFLICDNGKYHKNNLIEVTNKNKIEKILETNFIGSTSFPLLNKKLLLDAGGFDDQLKSCQEYDLYIRLLKNHNIAYSNKYVGVYSISNDSTYRNNYEKFYTSSIYIYNKNIDLFNKYSTIFNINLNNLSFYFLNNKCFKYFYNLKKIAIKTKPYSIYNFTIIIILKKFFIKIRSKIK